MSYTETRRRRKRRSDRTLQWMIAVLALVLVLVLVLAIALGQGTLSNPSDASQPSTQPSTQPGTIPDLPDTLTIQYPQESVLTVFEEIIIFSGSFDPSKELLIDGAAVGHDGKGNFTCPVWLNLGENRIDVCYDGQTVTYQVERRYVVEYAEPMAAASYASGATLYFKVSARTGSTVKAQFNGTTVTLTEDKFQMGTGVREGFTLYVGTYTLPSHYVSDVALGSIVYTATCDNFTETYTSGTITCLRPADVLASNPAVTPDYGKYIDVGSGYVAEIITFSAETFYGSTVDDYSHPLNNYLPEGTVDYCSTNVVKINDNLQYVVLRSGQRVYLTKRNSPTLAYVDIVDQYRGKLPDHNEIGLVSLENQGSHTVLTLDCLWKAPFYFDLAPQNYLKPANSSDRSYAISAFTAEYVDITLCYTPGSQFSGSLTLPENPLFASAELIDRGEDCILRLHLKKTGAFYGWDAYYNDNDQLCFRFLNPAVVEKTDGFYGANLTGVKVMIDVGHGGSDPGTIREGVYEADRNLALALALKKELESVGATVILNRSDDRRITVDERLKMLKEVAPDYCIAIHHNSLADAEYWGGFETFYYTPFSMRAAQLVQERTAQTQVYTRDRLDWHYYFTCRQTVCPVVLTENGFMSNAYDLENTLKPESILAKAQAMAQAICDYFLEIQ